MKCEYILVLVIVVLIIYLMSACNSDSSEYYTETGYYNKYDTDKTIKKLKIGPFKVSKPKKFKDMIDPSKYIQPYSTKLYVFNPSIAYDNNGEIIGVSRLSGNTLKECKMRDTDFLYDQNINEELSNYKAKDQKELSTVIMWMLKDLPNFTILPLFKEQDMCQNDALVYDNQGVEDSRLFRFRGSLWLYGHYRGVLGGCTHSPIIVPLDEPIDSKKIIKLRTDNMKLIEKNWMPFEYKNDLYFIYDVNPHIILKCDISTGYCGKMYSTDTISKDVISYNHIGGGAPPVTFKMNGKDYYLCMAHTRNNTPIVTRKNFFYVFKADPPFNIVMIGSEFNVMNDYRAIEFGSGLIISKDEKYVIISVGIYDCYSVMTKYPLKDLLLSLRQVSEL